MAEAFTVFIRVPILRGDFVDPPLVNWDASKDEMLWKILSSASQTEIDWNQVADRFRVPVDFLLQQVAYLTDRHATQVRAQVRKAAAAAKAPTPSATPIPGVDFALSAPGRERVSSLPLDTPLDGAALDDTPLEDVDLGGVPLADASLADTPPRSPPQGSVESASEDESSPAQSRIIRRPPRQVVPEGLDVFDEEDEEDEPAFQPYQKALQDLSSTLRGASKRSQASDSDTSLISRQNRTPGPLSPRRTAEMARSSSGKASSREGSDGTPSMGSSYSDLDDASVTQSALEEAFASHMNRPGASRFSISQAFRSRYTPSGNP